MESGALMNPMPVRPTTANSAMIDMLYGYFEGGSSEGLLHNTLESLTYAMQAELRDVGKTT